MARVLEPRAEWSGKTRWDGPLEDYPLERYPDSVPGQPGQAHLLERFSYQYELEKIWGKRWGSQGIGRLRETVLSMPTEHELRQLPLPISIRGRRNAAARSNPRAKPLLGPPCATVER